MRFPKHARRGRPRSLGSLHEVVHPPLGVSARPLPTAPWEVFDIWIQRIGIGEETAIPVDSIRRKLDTDFFAGRWARATDRQREMLYVVSTLENCDGEFSVQEIVDMSHGVLEKGFSSSHTNQMLVTLANSGLVYKKRYGRYSFAVPLMASFIRRQTENGTPIAA